MPQAVDTSTPTTTPTPAIDVRNLSVGFDHSLVIDDLSLTIDPGETVAIQGANGSGKSTLVKAITGIVPATSGTIHLFGQPLGRRTDWSRIGYVPQRISATSGIPSTALEVVTSGLLYGRKVIAPRGAKDKALEALDLVGLAHRANQPVHELSGGQQQRVLIARGIVRSPDLLILDEPVAGVDRPSQEKFAATISHLRETGTTVVVVLHELGYLEDQLSRSIVLAHGRIIHDGPPAPPTGDHAHDDHDHVHPHGSPPEPGLDPHLRHIPEGPHSQRGPRR